MLVGDSYFIYTSSSILVSHTASMSRRRSIITTCTRTFTRMMIRIGYFIVFGCAGLDTIPFLTVNNLDVLMCFFRSTHGRSNFQTLSLDELLQEVVKRSTLNLAWRAAAERTTFEDSFKIGNMQSLLYAEV